MVFLTGKIFVGYSGKLRAASEEFVIRTRIFDDSALQVDTLNLSEPVLVMLIFVKRTIPKTEPDSSIEFSLPETHVY